MSSRSPFESSRGALDSPSGVHLLRETILNLAVHGKLVPQETSDESAAAPLRTGLPISERRRLHRPFAVPDNWEWVRFAEASDTRLGKMLDKAKNTGPLRPYLRNANVQWFRFELHDVSELRLEDRDYETYALHEGDLVVCEGGEPGRAAICDATVEGMVFQKALHRARPRAGINVRYLAYVLRWYATDGRLVPYLTGATIKHLTGRSLASLAVPLPPTNEQDRIVAAVDRLIAECNEVEIRQADYHRATAWFGKSALRALAEAETDDAVWRAWERVSTNWEAIVRGMP